MRIIKFRAQDIASNKWLFGDIRHHKNDVCIFEQGGNKGEQVKPETVGQFTGLYDKNNTPIYEGDIIKWYEIGYSDHDVLEPPEDYIKECMAVVEFIGGTFCVDREEVPSIIPVEFLTEAWQANEDDMFKWVYNTDEYPNITVDDMYICEVVGNVFDNLDLIK